MMPPTEIYSPGLEGVIAGETMIVSFARQPAATLGINIGGHVIGELF